MWTLDLRRDGCLRAPLISGSISWGTLLCAVVLMTLLGALDETSATAAERSTPLRRLPLPVSSKVRSSSPKDLRRPNRKNLQLLRPVKTVATRLQISSSMGSSAICGRPNLTSQTSLPSMLTTKANYSPAKHFAKTKASKTIAPTLIGWKTN